MNCGAASWQRVMPLLAPHLRVAAYDRAGIGGSAVDSAGHNIPRDRPDAVDDTILAVATRRGPAAADKTGSPLA